MRPETWFREPGAAWALLAALLGLGGLLGCQESGPAGDHCAELSDSLFPEGQRDGVARFKVLKPEGGTFKVGSRMTVLVSGVDYTSALIDLVIPGPGGGIGRIPGFPTNQAVKPREDCEFSFAVPESLSTLAGGRISLISDSVKVRISDYTDAESFDYSDAFLSITR